MPPAQTHCFTGTVASIGFRATSVETVHVAHNIRSNGSRHMVNRATELELAVLVVSTGGEILSLTKEQPPAG
jgi:hypothetical protein